MRTIVTEKIVIYSKTHCGACQRAKALLRAKGVKEWTEYDLDQFPKSKGEMIERSGGRKTVPQIFIEGRHVGGAFGPLRTGRGAWVGSPPYVGARRGSLVVVTTWPGDGAASRSH